ncbi:unnamed protein product [Sphagnum troendelagicum]|uniref:Uncharacterized protein n=1 Tax=Sphagnum troendelagicum TaxID=128251 RepID=A0ABP0UML2_9BRYO
MLWSDAAGALICRTLPGYNLGADHFGGGSQGTLVSKGQDLSLQQWLIRTQEITRSDVAHMLQREGAGLPGSHRHNHEESSVFLW